MGKIINKKFISATDLKNKTKEVVEIAEELGEVFIMNNNKPKVIMVSIERYNYLNNYHIPEVTPDLWEKESISNYKKNRNKGENTLISEKDFFNSLKS